MQIEQTTIAIIADYACVYGWGTKKSRSLLQMVRPCELDERRYPLFVWFGKGDIGCKQTTDRPPKDYRKVSR